MSAWGREREARDARITAGRSLADGKHVAAADAVALLEAVLRPGDRVCLEGDNQKQADCLARALAASPQAEVFFPEVDARVWREVRREPREGFDFVTYEREPHEFTKR